MNKMYLYSFPNSSQFIEPLLAFREILCVKREGIQYDEVSGTPVQRQFKYTSGAGVFDFDTNIYDGIFPFGRYIPDRILVLYK